MKSSAIHPFLVVLILLASFAASSFTGPYPVYQKDQAYDTLIKEKGGKTKSRYSYRKKEYNQADKIREEIREALDENDFDQFSGDWHFEMPPMPAFDDAELLMDTAEWNDFSSKLKKKMVERFGKFYKNEKDFDELLEDLRDDFPRDHFRHAFLSEQHGLEGFKQSMEALHDQLGNMRFHMAPMPFDGEEFHRMNRDFDKMRGDMDALENELHDELVKDGYLKSGDEIDSMIWEDESLSINGKEIKPNDFKKYNEIRRKHLRAKKARGGTWE